MRKVVLIVALMLVATAAWAGPKDKTKGALVNPSSCRGSSDWDNAVVKAKYQGDAKQVKIQWKDTPNLNGDTVWCILTAKTFIASLGGNQFANNVLFKTVVDKGKGKIKGKLGTLATPSSSDTLSVDSTVDCYLDPNGTYDWQAACGAGGGLALPQDTETYKDDNLEGICQGFTLNPPIAAFPDPNSPQDPIAVLGSGSFGDHTDTCPAP